MRVLYKPFYVWLQAVLGADSSVWVCHVCLTAERAHQQQTQQAQVPLQGDVLAFTEPAFHVSESPHLQNSFLILEARS